jgi:hypothetical protein
MFSSLVTCSQSFSCAAAAEKRKQSVSEFFQSKACTNAREAYREQEKRERNILHNEEKSNRVYLYYTRTAESGYKVATFLRQSWKYSFQNNPFETCVLVFFLQICVQSTQLMSSPFFHAASGWVLQKGSRYITGKDSSLSVFSVAFHGSPTRGYHKW